MPSENPPLLLRSVPSELKRRVGRGGSKEPLVPVTSEFRTALASEIAVLAAQADEQDATGQRPMAVLLELHPKALAKSNRPEKLLASVMMSPVGAEKPGQLLLPATGARLRSLAAKLINAHAAAVVYEISTLVRIVRWSAYAVSELDRAALERGVDGLTVELFPWVAQPETEVRQALAGSESLGDSLELRSPRPIVPTGAIVERPVVYVRAVSPAGIAALLQSPNVRSLAFTRIYAVSQAPKAESASGSLSRPMPASEAPVVGVLDTGMSPTVLGPAVVAAEAYDPAPQREERHGTFVGALVVWARVINGDAAYPEDQCFVLDAQVIDGARGTPEDLLVERVEEVVLKHPGVRVWNCSFGHGNSGAFSYGSFAQRLDELSTLHRVLFVIAAGNYLGWDREFPPQSALDDEIGSPAEAVYGLTVGSRSLVDSRVPALAAASYSRRGPSFALHAKPEISHWAGDLDQDGLVGATSVASLGVDGSVYHDIGTSFAAPLVASTAATVWREIEATRSGAMPPEMIKVLMIHGARLAELDARSAEIAKFERNYLGWGTPPSARRILDEPDWSFTTVHEVQIDPGMIWTKPFPVPESLVVGGKFRGEVVLTAAFRPPVDANFKSEAVRRNIEVAFGSISADGSFHALTSHTGKGEALWEKDRVEDGKWSAVRTAYGAAPVGKQGGNWSLRVVLEERVKDEFALAELVHVAITLRALNRQGQVYNEGLAAVETLKYPATRLSPSVRIRT